VTRASERTQPSGLRNEQEALRAHLSRLRRRLQLQMALEGVLDAVTLIVATAALLVFLDWWFRLGTSARLVLFLVTVCTVIPYNIVTALRRLRATRLDDLALALTLDRFRPGIGGQIADVLQLPEQLDQPAETVSPALVRLAVQRASEALATSDWTSLWNHRRTALRALALFAALLVPTVFAVSAPRAARLSLERWLLGSDERWPQRTYLTVTGLGDRVRLVAPRDEPFAIEVRADLPTIVPRGREWKISGRGEPLFLSRRPRALVTPGAVHLRERTAKGAVRDSVLTATGPSSFRHELPPASQPSSFELTGGDDWLVPIHVHRVDRPALAATRLRVKEPGSPGAELRATDESQQQPVFLPDTELELTLVGDQPLSEAVLTVQPGQSPRLTRVDETSFVARWTLREATTMEVVLTSVATGLTSKPAYLSIGILKDREPRVALRALGIGHHVTPVATIPLAVSATDDRGLVSVRLQLERTTASDEKSEPKTVKKTVALPIAADPDRLPLEHQARHDVELQADPPPLGTLLRFVAEAEDRCARGAQVGRSSAVQIQVVSPNDLFYEILIRQRAERTKFIAVLDATEKQTPSLAGASASEGYAGVLRGLHGGSRQLELIAGRIADTLQEMKLNQIGSPKSHRLLQEGVIDPLRALNAGPVAEFRGALQSLSGTGPKTGAHPEDARRLHEKVVTAMKMILEQMSQWESFVDVVNQVAEVIKMQHNVLEAAEKARETRTREVFDGKP
jgi:hypothetical protein